ncbi:MAG: hypothetical protein OEX81_05930, partial [Candidatus Pacebacteria bacterium]|nr:hypothetical protein [Candidatus Paceibacterota bacterium]
FLRSGMFPQTRRLYRPDLLGISLRPVSIDKVLELANGASKGKAFSSHDEFLVLELYHYHGEEEFMALLQQSMPKYMENIRRRGKIPGLLRYLEKRDVELYTQKTFYDGLLLTHAHQDHAIGSSFIKDDIIRGWSPITRSLLLADHKLANAWYVQDTAARKRRDMDKVGAAYPVTEYPFINFMDGQRIEIAPGIFVTGHDVYHSIPGSLGFKVEVEHKGKVVSSLAYGGDYRDSTFFERLAESSPVDLLIIEGTNPPSVKKDSISVDEPQVRKNMSEVMNEARDGHKLLVIDIVKNNFERMISIIEEAISRGRTVVISPKIAWRCRSIELMQTQMPEHLRVKLPDFNDPRIKLWKKPMSRYNPQEREMFERHGYVDQDALSEVPEQYVLIRDGNEQPEKLEGINADAIWILSIYGTYDHGAAQTRRHLHRFAKQYGWEVRSKGYHATGHGPLVRSEHPDSKGSILDGVSQAGAKELAIVHTQKRALVSDAVRSYDELKDIPIHDKFTHPWYKIPLNKK